MKKITTFILCTSFAALSYAGAVLVSLDTRNITGNDTDVITDGNLLYAYTFGPTAENGGSDITINGVTFTLATSTGSSGSNENIAWSSNSSANFQPTTISGNYFGLRPNQGSLTAEYNSFLGSGFSIAGSSGSQSPTITLHNLTVGEVYLLQVWVNDSRANRAGTTLTFEGGNINVSRNVTNDLDGLGTYVVAEFTADSTSSVITLTGSSYVGLNGFQLRSITSPIPEPGTTLMAGLAGLLVAFRRRK